MLSALFLAAFTYPFWGLALLFLFCKWAISKFGPGASTFRRVVLVSPIAALLFSPVVFGTEGFAMLPHWSMALIDPRHSGFYFPLLLATLLISVVICFLVGRRPPPT
jgi:hypothetical protein